MVSFNDSSGIWAFRCAISLRLCWMISSRMLLIRPTASHARGARRDTVNRIEAMSILPYESFDVDRNARITRDDPLGLIWWLAAMAALVWIVVPVLYITAA